MSKTVPAAVLTEAMAAGQTLFGENRVQEAQKKIVETGPGAAWHLVGHLQKNKAKHAVGTFELIHGIDDRDVAYELDRRAEARSTVNLLLKRDDFRLAHSLSF